MSDIAPVADTAVDSPIRQEVHLILPAADSPAAAMLHRGIFPCKAGAAIATRVDVPANSAPNPHSAPAQDLRLGRSVLWDGARNAFIAQTAGHAHLMHGKLEVSEDLDLPDDIDAATGVVVYDGPVVVRRSVLDSAVLRVGGDLTVHGTIEAAEIHVGGNLLVSHGICGKERGRVSVGGRATARFLTNGHLAAAGDAIITNEIANSHLICGGMLKVEHGTILAGHIVALGGILCHTAGSDAGVKTILEVGLSPERYGAVQKSLASAEFLRKKAHDIRTAVEPLMARAKSLTAAQKEKATELLYAADEAETQANEAMAALQDSKNALQACLGARITVTNLLHAGVIIRFPLAEAIVSASMRGPLEIVLVTKGGETSIAAIDRSHSAGVTLQSLPHATGTADFVRQILVALPPGH